MSDKARSNVAVRNLVTFVLLILVLVTALGLGVKNNKTGWMPDLALDLVGGTQIILEPVTTDNSTVSQQDINQAIEIIRARIDSSGVSEAEITSEGGTNIVVSIPGTPSKETLDLVRQSAQMQFRPVLVFDAAYRVEQDPAGNQVAVPNVMDPESPAEGEEATPSEDSVIGGITISAELLDEYFALNCLEPKAESVVADPNEVMVACEMDQSTKYILGPMEIAGTNIKSADIQMPQGSNAWVVAIEFDKEGTEKFTEVTTRLSKLPNPTQWATQQVPTIPPNMFAMVLDNEVVSAPSVSDPITTGKAEISGSFTQESAKALADKLSFGALPLTFEVHDESTISATLGSEQLQKGLIAGLIGLTLVVIYSLFQYRALGLLTVVSLLLAAVLTFLVISLLSWWQGYRLSMAGVTGLIVAIGITADSFIVYYERIKDEIRDGKSLERAVDHGWSRAKRTILVSDAVNFCAAAVLYFLAVGPVRGFAFTLGLTTIIDLVIVFLFTHPTMTVLSKMKFFASGHPLSGLDPKKLGVENRYLGRGRVRDANGKKNKESVDDDKSLSIAERKAKQLKQEKGED